MEASSCRQPQTSRHWLSSVSWRAKHETSLEIQERNRRGVAYDSDLRHFQAWCSDHGLSPPS